MKQAQQGSIDTSCILYNITEKSQQYYLPCYVRCVLKNIIALNIAEISGAVNMTFLVTVFYGDMVQKYLDQLKSNIVLEMNGDQSTQLNHDGIIVKTSVNKQKKTINYTIRKSVNIEIVSHNIYFTPFLLIHLALKLCVKSLQFESGRKKVQIKFNIMDLQESIEGSQQVKFSFNNELSYGEYDVAQKKLQVAYTNLSDIQEFIKRYQNGQTMYEQFTDGKIKNFQTAFFRISLYRHPTIGLVTIFFPLWLLGILNGGVFFQSWELAGRIGTIATIALAYVALIPTIRAEIPKSSKFTIVQLFTYIQISASIFSLIYSITHRELAEQVQFIWTQSPTFILIAGITILQVVLVALYWLLHKCYLQPFTYNKTKLSKDPHAKLEEFSNKNCDDYFNRAVQNQKIKLKCSKQKPGEQKKQQKKQVILDDSF